MNLSPDMLPLPARPVHRLIKRFVLTADVWEEALRDASKRPAMNPREWGEYRRRIFGKFSRDTAFGNFWGTGYVEPTAKEELISRINATLHGKINGSPTNWRGLSNPTDDYRLLTGKRR